jgi:hypothetical protein
MIATVSMSNPRILFLPIWLHAAFLFIAVLAVLTFIASRTR